MATTITSISPDNLNEATNHSRHRSTLALRLDEDFGIDGNSPAPRGLRKEI